MDRPRRRSGRLTLAGAPALLAFGLALGAAAPIPAPPLKALRWLAPGDDPVRALARRPTECLGAPADAEAAYAVEIGRAAFRTPLLLGGQGARAGLSCETCHRSGRDNPNFDFPGVSGAPGSADVTTAVLSSHEADAQHGAVPIPNLSGPKAGLKIAQDPASRALEAGIDRIVRREFDGPEPPPGVLAGLAAYVRALSPAACPSTPDEPVTAAGDLADARRAASAALAALTRGDAATARVMIEAARSKLGEVDERFAGLGLAADRTRLERASGDLAAAAADVRAGAPSATTDLVAWIAQAPGWSAGISGDAPRSLYDPKVLAAAARRYRALAQATGRPPSSSLN